MYMQNVYEVAINNFGAKSSLLEISISRIPKIHVYTCS